MVYIGDFGNINNIYVGNHLCAHEQVSVDQYELIITCDDTVNNVSGRFAFLLFTGIDKGELQIYEINFYDGKKYWLCPGFFLKILFVLIDTAF